MNQRRRHRGSAERLFRGLCRRVKSFVPAQVLQTGTCVDVRGGMSTRLAPCSTLEMAVVVTNPKTLKDVKRKTSRVALSSSLGAPRITRGIL